MLGPSAVCFFNAHDYHLIKNINNQGHTITRQLTIIILMNYVQFVFEECAPEDRDVFLQRQPRALGFFC